MKKNISLKDIAERVGVSTALVSYVLNNKKENRISKDVARRIRETAKELNYKANFIAKSLKTKRTHTIGLLIGDISNSFFSQIARIIEDEADKHNYTVLFGSSDESASKTTKLINALSNHQVDGFIIAAAESSAEEIIKLQQNETPLVLIDRYFPDIDVPYVAIDNYKASYNAVTHLINAGSKNIGLLAYNSTFFHLQERIRGYTQALTDNNLPVLESNIKGILMTHHKADVEKAIDELTAQPQPVDAILFASNILSTAGLKYINALNLKVPDDMAIASFDQSDAADLFYAPLTYLKQPLEEMGRLAVENLLCIIEKNEKCKSINVDAQLVVGKSSLKNTFCTL